MRAPDASALEQASTSACLRSGPWDKEQAARLGAALQAALPKDSWRLDAVTPPPRWIVYLGKFSTPELLKRKLAQLAAISGVKTHELRGIRP